MAGVVLSATVGAGTGAGAGPGGLPPRPRFLCGPAELERPRGLTPGDRLKAEGGERAEGCAGLFVARTTDGASKFADGFGFGRFVFGGVKGLIPGVSRDGNFTLCG